MNCKGAVVAALFAVTAYAQVSPERIRNADAEPGNWLTYSRNYNGQRYSPLTQISSANANRLQAAWVYQIAQPWKFSASPIAIDGILYISEPPGDVVALDARTGRPLWRFSRRPPQDLHACCGSANRGLAVMGDMLFTGTLDAHLIAIDLHTGKQRWDTVVADYKT